MMPSEPWPSKSQLYGGSLQNAASSIAASRSHVREGLRGLNSLFISARRGEIGLLCIISLVAEPIRNAKRGLAVHGECLPTLSSIICPPVCLSIIYPSSSASFLWRTLPPSTPHLLAGSLAGAGELPGAPAGGLGVRGLCAEQEEEPQYGIYLLATSCR